MVSVLDWEAHDISRGMHWPASVVQPIMFAFTPIAGTTPDAQYFDQSAR